MGLNIENTTIFKGLGPRAILTKCVRANDFLVVLSASASPDCVYVHAVTPPTSMPEMHVGTIQAWTL
eukprot:11191976-Lingulodinium_polyedra.AAC.1